MRISDWSSDVCSSDLGSFGDTGAFGNVINSRGVHALFHKQGASRFDERATPDLGPPRRTGRTGRAKAPLEDAAAGTMRSEEHTSELQSLMRTSYAVFCLKKKKTSDEREGKPQSN